jgi:predicted ATP-dependent endonuclease of OLD family
LQEKGFQRVPLSKSGSGLKTIVLVLLNLLVIPHIDEYRDKQLVYGFEELENNLHPALQRRLFEYLYNYAINKDVVLFLTTHSHIAINAFYDKDDASIYHVIKENGNAHIKCIETHIDKTEILDDLDVKASDILQSNGIIWVEGPSDRIYIKRWLEIFTPNEYEEGKHYQFLYYGGRLLSQYSAKEETDLINIITTNRNAAIVIDSDKRSRSAKLNDTKKRIMSEFDRLGMFHWVTKGKETENYLPKQAIETMLDVSIQSCCEQYQLFPDYISPYYKSFSNKKVPFANQIKGFISSDNSIGILDLKKQIETLYQQIKQWNQ